MILNNLLEFPTGPKQIIRLYFEERYFDIFNTNQNQIWYDEFI